jgi:hypothetical protein
MAQRTPRTPRTQRKAFEGVKNSKTGIFASCNPLKIQVGARHGVPLRGFFHTFFAFAVFAAFAPLRETAKGDPTG